jgi:hypothetical protein
MKVPLFTFASRENELIAAIIIDLGQGRSRVTPRGRAAELLRRRGINAVCRYPAAHFRRRLG